MRPDLSTQTVELRSGRSERSTGTHETIHALALFVALVHEPTLDVAPKRSELTPKGN